MARHSDITSPQPGAHSAVGQWAPTNGSVHSEAADDDGLIGSVTVVVCAYTERRWDELVAAVRSLEHQSPPPDQIVVVVDYNPALLTRAEGQLPDHVQVVPNLEARGLAGARNTGIGLASGEVVAFLDDDAEADPGWLAGLLAPYRHPPVAGTGGLVLPQWPQGERPRWAPREFDWVVGCSYLGLPDSEAPVRNPIGASMSFRRSLLVETGGFDTSMGRTATAPLGCEETELAIRLRRRRPASTFVYVPAAVVHHHVAPERATLRYFVRRCHAEGRSKADLARLRGARDGLSSERQYVARTLPAGIATGLTGPVRGDLAGPMRALMIVVGLLATSTGFVTRSLGRRVRRQAPTGGSSGSNNERRSLFATFGYLLGQQGSTAILGLVFWVFVAHFFAPSQVGVAFAASYGALLLSTLGILGIPMFLIAHLSQVEPGERRTVMSTALAVSGAAIGLLAVAMVAFSSHLGRSLGALGKDPWVALFFVVGAAATAMTSAFDNGAVGIRRGAAQLTRGTLGSLLKFAGVGVFIVVGTRTSAALVAAWAIGLCLSLAVCYRLLRLPRAPHAGSLQARARVVRRYGVLSLNHHVLTLSFISVSYLVPVIAAGMIVARQYAYFATANTLASAALIVPWMLALALFAEVSNDVDRLHRQIRRTLPVGFVVALALVVVVELAAPLVLRLFGSGYSAGGTTALRLLILVAPSYVIKDHYVAIRRAQGQLTRSARVMAIGTLVEASGAAIGGALYGLPGICLGWALAAALEALALAPTVLRTYAPATKAAPQGEASSGAPLPAPDPATITS